MNNQRIEGRALLDSEETGDGDIAAGIRTQPIDGLGGKGDQPVMRQRTGSALDCLGACRQQGGGDSFLQSCHASLYNSSMETIMLTHSACGEHRVPRGHPERPARLESVLRAFDALADIPRFDAPRAKPEDICLVHSEAMVQSVMERIPTEGEVPLDADTCVSPQSGEAALRAAGAAIDAVDRLVAGEAEHIFCAVRPPGHHAEPDHAMGFCLFNSAAIAAQHAREKHGIERIAVVDFDVHHGNGTQAAFEADANLFYASTHEMPLYPGTGARSETGVANNIVNEPLDSGADGREFRAAFERRILPELDRFRPQLLLVSAGFDAHARDPLAHLQLLEEDFAWAGERLAERAQKYDGAGGMISLLEGGYDLLALRESVAAYVGALR